MHDRNVLAVDGVLHLLEDDVISAPTPGARTVRGMETTCKRNFDAFAALIQLTLGNIPENAGRPSLDAIYDLSNVQTESLLVLLDLGEGETGYERRKSLGTNHRPDPHYKKWLDTFTWADGETTLDSVRVHMHWKRETAGVGPYYDPIEEYYDEIYFWIQDVTEHSARELEEFLVTELTALEIPRDAYTIRRWGTFFAL